MPIKGASETKPLPLSDTLHDLAVLRTVDIDLAAFLPSNHSQKNASNQASADNSTSERDRLVDKSYEYVREGRAAIRLLHRGDVDSQGARIDKVRGELEQIIRGLEAEEDGNSI